MKHGGSRCEALLAAVLLVVLAASLKPPVHAQGLWTAHYSVAVTLSVSGGVEAWSRNYVLVVSGAGGMVRQASIKPYDKLGRAMIGMIGYPSLQHFYLGRIIAEKLYSWRRVSVGSITYEPLFAPVAYGFNGKVVMGILVRVTGPQGYKRAIYDAGNGLLLEEDFGLQAGGEASPEYYKVSITLKEVEGVKPTYMSPPTTRESRLAVYAASLIVLIAAVRTVVLRHKYTVI